jgi:hypothetical protein
MLRKNIVFIDGISFPLKIYPNINIPVYLTDVKPSIPRIARKESSIGRHHNVVFKSQNNGLVSLE